MAVGQSARPRPQQTEGHLGVLSSPNPSVGIEGSRTEHQGSYQLLTPRSTPFGRALRPCSPMQKDSILMQSPPIIATTYVSTRLYRSLTRCRSSPGADSRGTLPSIRVLSIQ